MRVLPVIDLKQGVVVRGIAGNRESYRPVVSQLVKSADPTAVATAFASKLAAADVYVADLDALGGAEPDWDNYRRIAAAGLKIWLDCGIRNVARARSVADFARQEKCLAGIIFALESVAGPADLRELVSFADPNLAIFSLDLLRGEPWSKSPGWQSRSLLQIAGAAAEAGVGRIVVVDLAQVGVGEGPSVAPLCRELRATIPNLELTAGGGVRHADDICLLADAGCSRVLVASALHDGRIIPADLVEL